MPGIINSFQHKDDMMSFDTSVIGGDHNPLLSQPIGLNNIFFLYFFFIPLIFIYSKFF